MIYLHTMAVVRGTAASTCYRMCSLAIECVLLLQNVFSYYRMCSLTLLLASTCGVHSSSA